LPGFGPAGFVYSEFSCARSAATSFPLSKHTGGGDSAPTFSALCVYLQLTWEVGLPPSPVEFSSLCHSHKLSCSCLLGARPQSHWSLSSQSRLVYLQSRQGVPSPSLQRSVRPTLFATCLYCSYCLLLSFSLFPRWRSVCPGGYVDLAQGCLWEYHILLSSTCPHLPKPSGRGGLAAPGALLVSPFNVKWRFSAPAGCVEGSKYCLFLVFLPARCVSSVLQDFPIGGMLSASSLKPPSWNSLSFARY
jgi:hypothetical protein